jgi:hypothetical protein
VSTTDRTFSRDYIGDLIDSLNICKNLTLFSLARIEDESMRRRRRRRRRRRMRRRRRRRKRRRRRRRRKGGKAMNEEDPGRQCGGRGVYMRGERA